MEKKVIEKIKQYLMSLQNSICDNFHNEDTQGHFIKDEWVRELGGGGVSCIYKRGKVFEGLGVNFSHIYGNSLPKAATVVRPELEGCSFEAMGVSIVAHPYNPYVPTVHCNVRFFVASKGDEPSIWWFGGGFDLTPYYGFEEDARHFHIMAKDACGDNYEKFKKNADEYFFLKNRNEPRGIGGIFFDDYHTGNIEADFGFMRKVGDNFSKAYVPIVNKRKNIIYGKRERDFQLYRRGRYVEFNLIYDRGTHFGLQSGGRTESILMSLPPIVHWEYNWSPEPGSSEAKLYEVFLKPRDWANFC